jgi:hypothetical protein
MATFALPDPASQPAGIAAGSDGNLWFTEYGAGRIGRITPAGAIAEFPLAPGAKPAGIAAGPDGNLWFTERGADRIGKITPAGRITEFPLPDIDSRPDEITVGPDGNLWFSHEGANRIGRITTAGEIAEYPVPVLTGTQAIAAGPDGNIWFSSYGVVGAIAPNGRLARLTCLARGCRLPALSLVADDGGRMWAGTATEFPSGGGGGGHLILGLTQPGYIARFAPWSSSTELTSEPPPVRRRRTRVRLDCGSASGCHGVLQLTRQRAAFRGEDGVNSVVVPIGRGRYDLTPGEQASVFVGLNHKAGKLLAKGRFIAWALAEAEGGDLETARLVSLRRGGAGG